MRVIDAEQLKKELDAWAVSLSDPRNYVIGDAKVVIDYIPAIDAVPLEPLCEWLYKNVGQPVWNERIAYMICENCEEKCSPKCWERVIKKAMEERNESKD